jgi:hypothetical protein
MDSAGYLIRAAVFKERSAREVASAHGASETWRYEPAARYRAGGDDALVPWSRRPPPGSRTPLSTRSSRSGSRARRRGSTPVRRRFTPTWSGAMALRRRSLHRLPNLFVLVSGGPSVLRMD